MNDYLKSSILYRMNYPQLKEHTYTTQRLCDQIQMIDHAYSYVI